MAIGVVQDGGDRGTPLRLDETGADVRLPAPPSAPGAAAPSPDRRGGAIEEYCARRNWLIGSPDTVARKIESIYRELGGFGALLAFGFDYSDHAPAWRHSLELIQREVMPRLQHLDIPKRASEAA